MSIIPTPAFLASGGYSTTQTFNDFKQRPETTITQFDITNSVQVVLDVRTFNNLIGIQKDASNIEITTTSYYDSSNNFLLTDNISLSAATFINGLKMVGNNSTTSNITSVGGFSTFYQTFANYIASYFGLPSPSSSISQGTSRGIATLYSNEYNFLPNNGVFDASALLHILTGDGTTDGSGAYINALTGTIELRNITKSLRYAVDTNCFGNRNATSGTTASNDASGNTSSANYGVTDGFYDGDYIFIDGGGSYGDDPSGNHNGDGLKLTLQVQVDPVYSPGVTTYNDTLTRSLGHSLVIKLQNLSACVVAILNPSNTSDSITFLISGTYSSVIIARGLTTRSYTMIVSPTLTVSDATSLVPNISTFVDTGLDSGTTYYYSFIPVDANGYHGIQQFQSGMTLSDMSQSGMTQPDMSQSGMNP